MSKLVRSEGFPAAEAMEDATMVRAMYRALEEGDAPALARYTYPLIEWVHPMVACLPFDGTRRGLQAVLGSAFQRDTDGLDRRSQPRPFWSSVTVSSWPAASSGAKGLKTNQTRYPSCTNALCTAAGSP